MKGISDLGLIKEAAAISTEILSKLKDSVHIGTSTAELDALAGRLCEQHKVVPAFKGVVQGPASPYPANICISINDEVLHAIPAQDKVVGDGDLVKLDFGIIHEGYYTDQCITLGVGNVASEDRKLIEVGKMAVEAGVAQATAGNTVGDIGNAIYTLIQMAGFDVLKDFVGHGIGRRLHEQPEVRSYGLPGKGEKLAEGMVICIEAQVVAGSDEVFIAQDGWSVKTKDGKNGVMFEYMVLVTKSKPEILTPTQNWEIYVKS